MKANSKRKVFGDAVDLLIGNFIRSDSLQCKDYR